MSKKPGGVAKALRRGLFAKSDEVRRYPVNFAAGALLRQAPRVHLILTMPQPGETIKEGIVVRWLKKVGETVCEKEPLVELETEKAVFNYESPFDGRIISIAAEEGASIPVGEPLAVFEVEESKAKGYLALGIGKGVEAAIPSVVSETTPSPLLSPRLRHRMKELGISDQGVAKIRGTGPGGRLTEADLQAYGARERPTSPHPPPAVGVRRIAVTPVRRRIAENMERAKREIPHAAAAVEADVTTLFDWKQAREPSFRKEAGVPLSFLSFWVWATVRAIESVPEVNASWKGDIIEVYDDVHVNLAIATPRGLFVPLLKAARAKTFADLSQEVHRLTTAATTGTLRPDEMMPGTITVNNHGAVGSVRALQVIRHPQAAIIGFGKIVERPWVVGGRIEIRKIAQIDLSFDHRVIDGDLAVAFLESVRRELEGFAARNP